MSSKRVDLNKRCIFILSGLVNPLGKILAAEMCRRFKPNSIAILLDPSIEIVQAARKELEYLEMNGIELICASPNVHYQEPKQFYDQYDEILGNVLEKLNLLDFELFFIVHNEGMAATSDLMEPQIPNNWELYVREHLYAVVALNQIFIRNFSNYEAEKLIVNIKSNFVMKPLIYSGLLCSSQKARDMYFRSMAAEERTNNVIVLSYAPGLMHTHKPHIDENNNIIDLWDLNVDKKLMKLPRVGPLQTTLKLINILQEMSFISGHELDYYDTYVL